MDVHVRTATALFDVPAEQVTREQRAQAKTVNFAVIYGQTQFALARNLKIERSEAKRYIDAGIHVLAGAPNLVRGTSHLGGVSAREAISCGAADMLCSDYHYPSVLRAPFVLARLGICTFEQAWSFVSEAPAAVAGLVDRGRIEEGAAADVIVVEPPADGAGARVRAVVVGGEVVYRVAAR